MRSAVPILALSLCALHSASAKGLRVSGIIDAVSNASLVETALKTTYKYTIVGGGTAGLVLAARLSESAENTVLVLEAGPLQSNNSGINTPAMAGSEEGTSLDWSYTTTPQSNLGNTSVSWPRGKLLGGSSTFNIMVLNRAFASDYDAWATLGNPGWDWKSLLPYHKKSENFVPPTGNNLNITPVFDMKYHGTGGPVQASFAPYISPQFENLFDGLRSLDVKEMHDPNGGDNVGVGWITDSIDRKTETRSSSETAYLAPNVGRRNLVVITNALATKVNFAPKKIDGNFVASGVDFLGGNSTAKVYTVHTSGEVILSGGSINSPQLLELSGVGSSAILNPLGIKTLIDLPGVGENLQDHPTASIVYKLKGNVGPSTNSLSNATFSAAAEAAYAQQSGILTQAAPILSYLLPSQLMSFEDLKAGYNLLAIPSDDLPVSQQKLVLDTYATSPILEIVPLNEDLGVTPEDGGVYIGIIAGLQHALARGSSHINSTNPQGYPIIDPKYFSHPADAYFLAKGLQFIRKLAETPSMSSVIDTEARPGLDVLPLNATDADWESWASQHIATEYHPIGTTSMLPRKQSGVVSPELIVYGTENLRVIDAGIIPLHIATHIQSTAYAIGEKGAALILGKK